MDCPKLAKVTPCQGLAMTVGVLVHREVPNFAA
jgi:hypothetical protein